MYWIRNVYSGCLKTQCVGHKAWVSVRLELLNTQCTNVRLTCISIVSRTFVHCVFSNSSRAHTHAYCVSTRAIHKSASVEQRHTRARVYCVSKRAVRCTHYTMCIHFDSIHNVYWHNACVSKRAAIFTQHIELSKSSRALLDLLNTLSQVNLAVRTVVHSIQCTNVRLTCGK